MTSKIIYTPYTYLIGWTKHNKWYYGVRYAKGCHPSQFWKKYFTSSKYVKSFREQHGEPDVIQIRHTFDNSRGAREWEIKVLKKMNVVHNNKWLNKAIGAQADEKHHCSWSGKRHTNKTRRKMSQSAITRSTPEYCQMMSTAVKNRSDDYKQKIVDALKGIPKTEVHKQHLSIAAKNRSKITCPHCGKIGDPSNMKRWHFDNCKLRI